MNNLLSYCGLVDAKIRASDKDLPVLPNETLNRLRYPQSKKNYCLYNLIWPPKNKLAVDFLQGF